MALGLSDEDRELRESIRGWTARYVTAEVRRAAVEAKSETLPTYWDSLAELGLLGLHLPDEFGGAGHSLFETAIVAEELGRAMVPGPYLASSVTSAVLCEAGSTDRLAGLASGTSIGAMSLHPGSLGITREVDRVTLSGISSPVLGGQVADVFLLAVEDRGRLGFLVLDRDRLQVTELPSHDLVRRNAEVSVDRLALDETDVLSIDAQRVIDIAASLFSAEAAGLAEWATTTAAEYARVRKQFGRVIGQFQGVKHTVARMLCRTEHAVVTAWDAARAQREDSLARESSLAAAVAAATAPEEALQVTKACIQVLGGIGYTWEHDAHLYLRRAQSLRLLLGSSSCWNERVADLTLAGTRRTLGVELPREAEQVRERVRAELGECPVAAGPEQSKFLGDHGYTAPHLQSPWGRDADAATQLVIAEELSVLGLQPPNMIIGNWAVPTLLAHGSPDQVQRWVPGSLRGEIVWCQLFSEPEAGSDLASLSTKARKVAGGWKLQGQKVWTSKAHVADWGICLARTDPSASKHEGLSYFVIDLKKSAGVDIRPLREITGDALFNEVFLDDVFVPDDCLIGGEGDGWRIARTTLANERVMFSNGSSLGTGGEVLLSNAAEFPGGLSQHEKVRLGNILCAAQSGELMRLRSTLRSVAGGQPGTESSVGKLLSVEHLQDVWELAMEWGGADSLVTQGDSAAAAHRFLNVQCMSIAGGTTNVQLNIIGERILGLPRDPELRC